MEITLKEIMSISGYPGLFKFVSQGRNGVIVESLIDGKRMNASTTSKVTTLSDIAIFTESGEIALKDVLKKIREKSNSAEAIDSKSDSKKLREFFAAVLPDYDKDQVHDSHIKKVIGWYNLLQSKEMLNMLDAEPENGSEENTDNA